MTLKDLPHTVVHVPTQDEYDELMKIYEDAGWKWHCGGKPITQNYWDLHKYETCILAKNKCEYGRKDFYELYGFEIITLQQFKELQGLTTMRYKQGDILVNQNGNKRKVLGVCGEVYILSAYDNFDIAYKFYTQFELDDMGYKLYTEEPEDLTELTLEEVAKKFNVDVSKLRIKES